MAVSTTLRQLVTAALARSSKNRPIIAAPDDEMLRYGIRLFRAYYVEAAKINPDVFGDQVDVDFAGSGWARPSVAEVVSRIEYQGAEVAVVPFDDRTFMAPEPAVYERGGLFRSAGNAHDPTGTLTFFYSKRPDDPASLEATVDPLWLEQFNEMAIIHYALYFAQKDGNRETEMQEHADELDAWKALFTAYLERPTIIRRRFAPERGLSVALAAVPAPVPSRIPTP